MASILVISSDRALLEGMSQTLSGAGHEVVVAADISEAVETLRGARPLVALVNRDELHDSTAVFQVSLARGGALLTFRTADDAPRTIPFRLRRATLADLQLPLEKQRLLALIRYVETRVRTSGRSAEDGDAEVRL